MITRNDKQDYGQSGGVAATAGAIAAGEYCMLQCLTDCVLTSFTSSLLTGTITGVTLPARTTIKIPFTAATLTSGTAIAFRTVKD